MKNDGERGQTVNRKGIVKKGAENDIKFGGRN